ncbi:MAG: cobalamin-dependent protein [Planctomycetota bacterium]|nr:MAG: cobalamin-dependent protein [Planctomycetota bacterium]
MGNEVILGRYLRSLLTGDRKACRAAIEQSLQSGMPANLVYVEIIWPIMVEVEQLWRSDRITAAEEHLATRINRTIVDQLQNKLPRRPAKDKKIAICCAQAELQELGAQIMADLFESDGWEVKFVGGGLSNEDILAFIHEYAPDILLIYGTAPKQAPDVRRLIDTIREISAWPNMRIMLSGGLFNRAEGLWEEVGADLFAATALEALQVAAKGRRAEPEGRTIKRRRRRREQIVEGISPGME